jgi:3-oxoacyl-(acyl-carrier-protein) synthase
MRRIVVTGTGAISPLGANVKASWSRLLSGRSGLRRLPDRVHYRRPTHTVPAKWPNSSGAIVRLSP